MRKISFPVRGEFTKTLRKRVDQYLKDNNLRGTGNWRMYLKTAFILTWLVSSYIILVFFASSLWMTVVAAFAVAQGFVLVGFNIMHDGNHGSYSKSKTVNSIMGFTLNLIGGSSYLWKQKHNILHHTYTNIDELDDDLHTDGLLRFSPEQEQKPMYRYQHLYAIPLYSFLTMSWILYGDFKKIFTGRIGEYTIRRPSASGLVVFSFSKLFYFGYTIVLPSFFHPIGYVLAVFLGIHLILGFTLAIVFQLAHTVEGTEFPVPDAETGNIENEWAIHQIETTVNFAPTNKLATWYFGGLNFQIEHHLFSKICHIHYPAISKIVEETCREFSIRYVSYPTFRSAIISHFRFLKMLGMEKNVVPV